ncbi:Glutaconyl-CoA decarboxylase beta subunit (EC 4.1.1.70) [Oscillospiraceae bacterium]|nr:Glutaconyl-CoA decarboxylase beta subunit (EC 4.1.1.70) [Oscillospiraceae bacterium]
MGFNVLDTLSKLATESGFAGFFAAGGWQNLVMIVVACVLLYLGIVKGFEPLLLVGIAFGCLLANVSYFPGLDAINPDLNATNALYHPELWSQFLDSSSEYYHSYGHILSNAGLLDIFYIGVKAGLYPSLIFMGVGAMTDFGPLIADPKSLLLGAAAQLGVFVAFFGAICLGFTGPQAASIGIIGGADGPTAIFLTNKLAPELLGAIAIAAYSYMALIPLIQPPIMKLLTSEEDRKIKMVQARVVSKSEKILFPIIVTIFVILLLPSTAPLVGCLMLGNLFRECGVTDRLSDTVQNALMNIVTIMLSTSVGATMVASNFLKIETLKIILLGLIAFGISTVGGLIGGNIMCKLSGKKVNPLIGSAGVSAVPMAARVSQMVGQKANPSNFLLMHAMGPNVAGVIGSAIAAGFLLAVFG